MRASRWFWSLIGLVLLLSGCVSRNTQSPTARHQDDTSRQPRSSAASPTATTAAAAPSSTADWHTLYTRPGFDGSHSVDLRAVGDISLARYVEPVVRRHDPAWLFTPVAELLRGDVVVGNLESPFVAMDRSDTLRPGPYRLPADPALADRLAPFTALALANNHALDADERGLIEAQRTLQEHEIMPLGLGGPCAAATRIEGAVELHLLAFNAVADPQDRADEAQGCGRAWLDAAAIEQVAQLRRTSASPIVVLVHWGDEYASAPNQQQRHWAHELVAAGADLIIGAHPHVVQPTELIEAQGRRGFVAYSLGNFVFDQPDQPATSHSVVLRVQLDREGVGAVAAAPVAIRNAQPIPLPLDDPAARAQLTGITASVGTARAWRWNGASFAEIAVPPGTTIPATPAEIAADLRGDGAPLRVSLRNGLAQVWDDTGEVWRNEDTAWQVEGMAAGDADNDGRYEVLLRLWKPDAQGVLRSHPFMLAWRGGYYRVFWGGSAVTQPIQDAAIGPVSDSHNALVVLEGGSGPDDTATHVGVWTWQGWNFQQQWQSAPGSYQRLALLDLDGDGRKEIVVE